MLYMLYMLYMCCNTFEEKIGCTTRRIKINCNKRIHPEKHTHTCIVHACCSAAASAASEHFLNDQTSCECYS